MTKPMNLMPRCNLLLGAVLLLGLHGQGHAAAPITSVVVYSDRAQVTRSQSTSCARGRANFTGLPSTLDVKTLWATLSGGAGEVLGLTYQEEATGSRPKAKALKQTIEQLNRKLAQGSQKIRDEEAIEHKLAGFKSYLTTIWGRQATTRKAPIASWDAALNLLRLQTQTSLRKRREVQIRQRALIRERLRIRQELSRIKRDQRRTTYRVTAHIKCKGQRKVALFYVVPHATWRVAYQARAAKNLKRVTMIAQAIVQQGTGEDWTNIALAVSTANLKRVNIPPKIQAIHVRGFKPAEVRKILARRFEQRRHLTTSSSPPPSIGGAGASAAPTPDTPDQGLAMQLPASSRVTIPSDGRQVAVVLARASQKAKFSLETVPKLYPFVYRRLSLINSFSFPMLPGPIEIYHGRTFHGQAQTKLRAPREPFSISLGVNKQIKVKRYVKRERLEGSGAFGSKKKLQHQYTIQVGNWTKKAQRVQILENIPVSRQKEIRVSLTKDTTSPSAWNKEDGILTWKMLIPPRSKRVIKLGYTVALPDEYEVSGY